MELATDAVHDWQESRDALFVVESSIAPTNEQLAGRYLARCGRALTPSELRDELRSAGSSVTAAALKRAMVAHPAFSRHPGDRYSVGRSATGR
jgi:hypothetical protein